MGIDEFVTAERDFLVRDQYKIIHSIGRCNILTVYVVQSLVQVGEGE